MKSKPFGSRLSMLVIAVLLVGSAALIAAKGPRGALSSGLEDIARIKDALFPGSDRLAKMARLEQLARIKDDMFPADERQARIARLAELARIKDAVFPQDELMARAAHLEELERIKDTLGYPDGYLSQP